MNRKHSDGYIMIAVLVAIAILALLYFVQIRNFFPDSVKSAAPKVYRPWHDEDLLVPDGKRIPLPDSPKPDLEDGFAVYAAVTRNGSARGSAVVEFKADGNVTGTWESSYAHENRRYIYQASFDGNVVINKTYKDNEGNKDKSRLFFFTKGTYTQAIEYSETGRSSVSRGTVYLTGWLNPDYTAKGLITIRKDEDWSARYEFSGARGIDH